MNQPADGEGALSEESAAEPGAAHRSERKPDAKALTLVGAGMLTILASVITLFVDKLELPLRVSLLMGLLGIGLAGAASIMQVAPDRWTRPVSAVAIGTAGLMVLTFFLTPHPKAAATLNTTTQQPGGMTLEITPDHGRISATLFVSGSGCPRPGGEIHIYFDGKDLFAPATCLANHTYMNSYSPTQNGTLRWFDGAGDQHNLTLAPGSTYTVYAQTTSGDSVSPRVTYRVG